MALQACVQMSAAPMEGFLRYVPEAQAIRDAALAAFAPRDIDAGLAPEPGRDPEVAEVLALLAASADSPSDPMPVVTVLPEDETPVPLAAPGEISPIEPATVAETPDHGAAPESAAAPAALDHARQDVLTCARLLRDRDQQQQEARTTACCAEEAWVRTRYASDATKEQLAEANRSKRAARRAFAQAWEEYLAASQSLCHCAEQMVELEAPAVAV